MSHDDQSFDHQSFDQQSFDRRAPDSQTLDGDLESLSRSELVKEIIRLRQGIRRHRDSTGHDLCWHHPDLWGLLPDSTDPLPEVPDWPTFMKGCLQYRQALDLELPSATRTSRPY